MKLIELKQLIADKLGIALSTICAEDFKAYGVRFHYLGSSYRATTDLTVEKVDDGCLVADVDARQIENLLRGEEWNGEGLPPVGHVVEFTFGPYSKERGDFSGPLPSEGQGVEVVAHKTTSDGNDVAVVYWDDCGAGRASCFVSSCLKPLKTEEDKKRDAAISSIDAACLLVRDASKTAEAIYDAIAAGDVPGVKIG